jgi:monovalent cation:H+ antiporter-2, CPA2 family
METLPILREFAVTVTIGVLCAVLLGRLRIPVVAGLLAAGAVLGPYGLKLVKDAGAITQLAEAGVVLLLFTIGLEFSLARLRHIARHVVIGGSLQVGLTVAAAAGIAMLLGQRPTSSVLWGFVFAMSSTAVVLRALGERGELDAPHGRFIVGALIFQDLCVVPMMLLVPVLAGRAGGNPAVQVAFALGKAAAVVVVMLLVARLVIPRLLAWVDATRSREVFVLAVLGICAGTGWLTSHAGLSVALGAFLAGLMLADTIYGRRAMSEVLPLRDAFTSIFFISLGMLFDARQLLARPLLIAVLVAAFLFGKALVATLSAMSMRFPARALWLAGIGLAQFGEFGFVLAKVGQEQGLLSEADVQALLAAGVLSIFLTPLAIRVAPHITAGEKLLQPLARLIGARSIDDRPPDGPGVSDHVVIVGYGLAGRLLAESLAGRQIPFLVLELNAETVRKAQAAGEPVFYGDVTSVEALEHARLGQARALVLLINDPAAARRAVDAAHKHAPQIPIIMRTRYIAEEEEAIALGASHVICEELESAVEAVARVMRQLAVPRNLIEERVEQIRDSTQASARKAHVTRAHLAQVPDLGDLKVDSLLVRAGDHACGRSAAAMQIRTRTEALVVAVRREGAVVAYASPDESFRAGDVVFLVGPRAAMGRALELFARGAEE